MRDVLGAIDRWRRDGQRLAVATVVKVWGSAPRPLGSKMAISEAGDMAGSVSGGCVEGAVYEEAQGVIARGEPKLVHFGVSNEEAWAVGLSCGGQIDVFVETLGAEIYEPLKRSLDAERLVALATVVAGPGLGRQLLLWPDDTRVGGLGDPGLERQVGSRVGELFSTFASERKEYQVEGTDSERRTVEVFLEIHPPRPKLIVVGAVHVAIPLVGFARALGFRTVVVDPRTAFATRERFPEVDELVTDWPDEALETLGVDENTFVALLSHDLKLDLPALEVALARPARYIGALGSKKTHAKRVAALREKGIGDDAIARIASPIGLDLGGRRAEEIAVAIIAEMVAVGHGRRP